ncbi:MAG: hypothetical protein PHW63_00590 [Alphaproteobacteria bacterium]|nr:hypothetical protein [Alphaproteobacteria bacterium]
MKLVFSKNEELEISVHKLVAGEKTAFSYTDMIKDLINTRRLDEPELEGKFTDTEKESIISMVEHINTEVADFFSDEEGPES